MTLAYVQGNSIIWEVGEDSVVFGCTLVKDDGTGSAGESPTVALVRLSDGFYLDWNDNTFKAAGWTTQQKVITEIAASPIEGVYRFAWDSSATILTRGEYMAEYENTGTVKFLGQELHQFVMRRPDHEP